MNYQDMTSLAKLLNSNVSVEQLSEFIVNHELDRQALEMLLVGVNVFTTALTPEAKVRVCTLVDEETDLSFRNQMRAKVWRETLNKL